MDLGRLNEAMAVFDVFLSKFGESSSRELRLVSGKVMINRAIALRRLGRMDDAVAAFGAVSDRFRLASTAAERSFERDALLEKAESLERIGRTAEAQAIRRDVDALTG